jgi:hypothetical protein
MKIENVFKTIKTGLNYKNINNSNGMEKVYTFEKNALSYATLCEGKLKEEIVYFKVDSKYFMKPRDIIISLRSPYEVGTITHTTNKKILIPNNYAILRDIDMDKYSYIFVTNYLQRIGIAKYVKKFNKKGSISLEDIKNIDLPDISKEKQMTISNLMESINERSNTYIELLENDNEIMNYLLKKVVGDIDE